MSLVMRHIVVIICLVAYVCGGSLNVCACDLLPPATACESHDHSDRASHDHNNGDSHDNGCENTCPCATCHSCNHPIVVLPEVKVQVAMEPRNLDGVEVVVAPRLVSFDIFTPPKLS